MKTSSAALLLCPLCVLAVGCASQAPTTTNANTNIITNANTNTNTNDITNMNTNVAQKELTREEYIAANTVKPVAASGMKIYEGSWFDIQYPSSFSARPPEPKEKTGLEPDEAFFTSPDKTVEFFVYSPLWGGDPKDYLNVAPNEKLVSEKESSSKENGGSLSRWVTVAAKDGSYTRSYVSVKGQIEVGGVHHVFGIKYKDQKSYDRYKADYEAFKKSLMQYAD